MNPEKINFGGIAAPATLYKNYQLWQNHSDYENLEVSLNSKNSKREQLRRKRQAEKRKKTLTFVIIAAVVIVLIGLAAILPRVFNRTADYEQVEGFYLGDPNAPIKVVEFSRYTCSHCKTFAETMEADFIADYVDTGKVYFRYVNLASGTEGLLNAGEASYCAAEQNKFFEYKSYLYTYALSETGFEIESLINYAESAGLDVDQFTTCLESDTYGDAYLGDQSYAQSVDIPGTPSFLVNDQIVFASELFQTLDELLAEDS